MKCPNCSSEKVTVKREKTGEVQGSYSKKHGAAWWICIGWIFVMLDIGTLGIFHGILFRKSKAPGKASLWHTVAICRDCGHTWQTAEK